MNLGASPVPVLIIIGIYVGCFMAVGSAFAVEDQVDTYGLDASPTIEEPDDGFFDILASIISAVWAVVLLLMGALTFDVPGIPTEIRVPIAIAIIGAISWSIATLIRGN